MRKQIMKKVTKEVEVIDYENIKCDCCKHEIFNKKYFEDGDYDKNINRSNEKFKFFTIRTGHHDWGKDSIESMQSLDICSKDCLMKQIEEFLKEDSFTAYFNIQTQEIVVDTSTKQYYISNNLNL